MTKLKIVTASKSIHLYILRFQKKSETTSGLEISPFLFNSICDHFVTYTEGFNMHTEPNPQSIIDEYFSGKNVLNSISNKYVFPALNVFKSFAPFE